MDHDATDTDTDAGTGTDTEEREEAAGSEEAREHTADEIAEIEAERERRLDPANRPENAIVDNSDADLPTVAHFAELDAEDEDASSGSDGGEERKATSDPSQKFTELEYSEAEVQEMAEERERRLDPDNRPDNVEVDNTGRTFDTEEGRFVDDDDPSPEG